MDRAGKCRKVGVRLLWGGELIGAAGAIRDRRPVLDAIDTAG
jgi:hypothetical protein